jgi:SAM-dependent methyltransferase
LPAAAIEAALALLRPQAGGAQPAVAEGGYIDLLGAEDPTGSHPGQRLMLSRALPLVYERLWRPLGARLLMGAVGPGTIEEHRIALEMLAISPGDTVLDVGCGPGNFSRDFARAADEGLVIGLDASETMLAAAVREVGPESLAYVRGDAHALPFGDECFDAVCCFAALYLIEDPMRALDEIARVIAPGGRVALLASCSRGPLPTRLTAPPVEGKANAALARVLGKALGIPPTAVRLLKGAAGRNKLVALAGIDAAAARERLGA